ncbi:MAG: hypothetical protein FWH06_05490 [Oscillospiraceae bacterium]|nr:hypothetical protein [Oscillospiraceae bacterium]
MRSARAEESLIGLVLQNPELIDVLQTRLTASHFSVPFLSNVWEQAVCRREAGAPVSLAVLSQSLTSEETAHLAGVLQRPAERSRINEAAEDCLGIILRASAAREAVALGEDPVLARALQSMKK